MATTTTNFGWDIPQSTDLVKDGATAIATLGQDIDTALIDLKGGTSGQLLAKNSNTDLDYTWVDPSTGDITGVSVTSPITGGGTAGNVTIGIEAASTTQSGAVQLSSATNSTSTTLAATASAVKSAYDLAAGAIPKTLTTTTGDIIYASSANTPARLGIGSSGQYLTVSGGVPAWAGISAGGMTLISTTTLSGASTTISSIPSTYTNLIAIFYNMTNATSEAKFQVNWNSTGTFVWTGVDNNAVYSVSSQAGSATSQRDTNLNRNTTDNTFVMTIYNYAGSGNHQFTMYGTWDDGTSSYRSQNLAGMTVGSSAVSSLTCKNTGGNFNGGTCLLYGVK